MFRKGFCLLLFADIPPTIQISTRESIIATIIFIATIGVAWGKLTTSVKDMSEDLEEIKTDFKALNKDFITVKTLVEREVQEKYAKAHSPRRLTTLGKKVLRKSGIKEVIDDNRDILIELAKQKKPANAYDAELYALQIVKSFVEADPKLLNEIKEKTFAIGETFAIVLFVGGLYFRDIALPRMGFTPRDIDLHSPKKDP